MNFPKFNLLVVCLAGWLTQQQNRVIDFLMEENRTLHELLGDKRPKLSNRQRRRLAVKPIFYTFPGGSGRNSAKH